MSKGFRTTLEFLQEDIDLEEKAVRKYTELASKAVDQRVKETFQKLALASRAHVDAFKRVVDEVEEDRHPIILYCPFCGWELNFGENPSVGNEEVCAVCCRKFALVDDGGDFKLKWIP